MVARGGDEAKPNTRWTISNNENIYEQVIHSAEVSQESDQGLNGPG